MYADTLRAKLRNVPGDAHVLFDFGGRLRGFKQLRNKGIETGDDYSTVIETGDSNITVDQLLLVIAKISQYDQIQLFEAGGDDYGYYEVGNILSFQDTGMVWITAGPVIVANV